MTVAPTEVRRRALLAAAKATLSLSVLGCGPSSPSSAPGNPSPLASGSAGTVCRAAAKAPHSLPTLECCTKLINDETDEQMVAAAATNAGTLPPPSAAQTSCCGVLIDAINHQASGTPPLFTPRIPLADTIGAPLLSSPTPDCCGLVMASKGSMKAYSQFCSPWGPPMPPAMPEYLRA